METGTTDAAVMTERQPLARRVARALSFNRISGIYVWAGLIIYFSFATDNFLSTQTLRTVASEEAVTALVALGLMVALASGVFDLSISGSMGLTAIVTAKLISGPQWPIPVAIIVALLLCSLIGLFNALLVLKVKIDPFIATLGTQSILTAIVYIVSDNKNVSIPNGVRDSFRRIAAAQWFSIPIPVFYVLALVLVLWYVLAYTPLGRRLYATGGNPEVARLAGIRTTRYIVGAFVMSAVVAGIAGVVATAKVGTGSPELGRTYLLPAFAAGFLGATQFRPGRFNPWGTVVAVYLLATGVKGLVLMGVDTWAKDMFNGAALIVAVGLSTLQRRQKRAVAAS